MVTVKYDWLASDAHIGINEDYSNLHRFCHKASREARSLSKLGDTFDRLFSSKEEILTKSPHKEAVADLRSLAEIIPVRLFLGNHDLDLSDMIEELKPIQVLGASTVLNGKIYLCHGHLFDFNVSHFGNLCWWLAKHYPKLLYLFRDSPHQMQVKQKEEYGPFVSLIHAQAQKFAMENGYSMIGHGHTHSPQILLSPTLPMIIDVGDITDSGTYCVLGPSPLLTRI